MIDARRLWTAVLMQAIADLAGDGDDHYHSTTIRYFARLWFTSDNHDPGSFLWICDHLEFDPSWLRRRLFEIVDQAPNSKGIFERPLHRALVRRTAGQAMSI